MRASAVGVERRLGPQLLAAESRIDGVGLHAAVQFAKGEPLYTIQGARIAAPYDDNFEIGPNWVGVGWCEWIDPVPDNPIMFTNHSCAANAIVSEGLFVVALRDIRNGEEIAIDYSTTEIDPAWRMTCSCGSACCRGVIGPFQSLPITIQRHYRPFLGAAFVSAVRRVAS